MHDQMVYLVARELASGTPIAVSLTNTLNAVTSNYAARAAAIEDRLPVPVVILLFISAVFAALLVGREQGEAVVPQILGTLSFIFLTSLAVYVTLDLNQPERGLITVSQGPIERLLSSMPK
jgi:protein-S-isoprenylcysteine O-methyltransferase Ste14